VRILAVTAVLLVTSALVSPLVAAAQTSGQQAVGIFLLFGASKSGAQANAKAPGQKPKPAASREAQARIVAAKPMPLTAKVAPTDSPTGKHN
jgi:hypothetical protein